MTKKLSNINWNKQSVYVVVSLIIIVVIISLVCYYPFIEAILKTSSHFVFLGQVSWFDPWDMNVYVSAIHSGQIRGILLPNLYTTTPGKSLLIYPFYTILGKLFAYINPFVLFNIVSIVIGLLFVIGIYTILSYFFSSHLKRFLATLIICLAGGLGFYFYPRYTLPDMVMTSFTMRSLFQRPHEAIAVMTYILSLVAFYLLSAKLPLFSFKRYAAVIGPLIITLLIYPYYLLSYLIITALYIFVRYRNLRKFPIIFYGCLLLFAIPIVIWYFTQLNSDAGYFGLLNQIAQPPNPLSLLLGYGFFSPFILYQFIMHLKKDQHTQYLAIWFIVSILLGYFSFSFSGFYLRGLFFPATILALYGLADIAKRIHVQSILLYSLFFFIVIPTNIAITQKLLHQVNSHNPWLFMAKEEYESLMFLKKSVQKDEGILTLFRIGNLIPSYTSGRAYLGHKNQTPDYDQKYTLAALFYAQRFTSEQAKEFLHSEHIKYVYFGEEEKITATIARRQRTQKLEYPEDVIYPVFKNKDITIYRVK